MSVSEIEEEMSSPLASLKIRIVDDQDVSDIESSKSDSKPNVIEILSSSPPPSPTVRTVDDEDISDSKISEYSLFCDTKYFTYNGIRFRNELKADDELYQHYYKRYCYQWDNSDGFDINWDEFDFLYPCRPVDWLRPLLSEKTNEELVEEVTLYAIKKHNEESGENVEFIEHVKANFVDAVGYVFFITFWARDASSPAAEPKLYQTIVWRFAEKIRVEVFRPRASKEEITPTQVRPPSKVDPPAP